VYRLNEAHGGVWALQYDAGAIAMHFFPRSAIPADISSGNPGAPGLALLVRQIGFIERTVPSGWGTPKALFNGFDIMQFVNNQILVINTGACVRSFGGSVASTLPAQPSAVSGRPRPGPKPPCVARLPCDCTTSGMSRPHRTTLASPSRAPN
jgi:hypothetical protein